MPITIDRDINTDNSRKSVLSDIPIFIIDDDVKSISSMKRELKNVDLAPLNLDIRFYHNTDGNVELDFIDQILKLDEAIIIADYDMGTQDRNGIILLNSIMDSNPGAEYYTYLFTGKMHGNETSFREDNPVFEGKIYNKRADGFTVLILNIHAQIKIYKGIPESAESENEWDQIVSIIDKKFEILTNPPKGSEIGSLMFQGVEYTFSELRDEINDPNSNIGKKFILTYIKGILTNEKIISKYT